MGLIIGGRYEVIRRQDGRLILIDFGGVKQIGSQWYQNGQNRCQICLAFFF